MLKKNPRTFSPNEWVPLQSAFDRIKDKLGARAPAFHYLNEDLRSGRLRSALVHSSEGKTTLLKPSNWKQWSVQEPPSHSEDRVWVPGVNGYLLVRGVDLDKRYPTAATPTMTAVHRSDDTRPPERRRGPVTTHDWHSIDGEIARRCIDSKTGRVAVPQKESALAGDMRTWCKEKGWAVPAISEMSEAVRRICAALRTVQK
jgi:hypothetical protein